MRRKRIVPCTAIAALACALIQPRLAAMEEDTSGISERAPILSRILEKRLEEAGTKPNSIQWARLPGRGLLYVVQMPLASMSISTTDEVVEKPSEADRLWENTARELKGLAPAQAREGEKAIKAAASVSSALSQFSGRVGLPEGEQVRAILYSATSPVTSYWQMRNQGTDSMTMTELGLQQAMSGRKRIPDYVVVGSYTKGPVDMELTAQSATELEIAMKGAKEAGAPEIQEDASVLARVIEKKVSKLFPDEYWGKDLHGRPGMLGFVAGDWGPVVVVNMTFPLEHGSEDKKKGAEDLWTKTRKELRGVPVPPEPRSRYKPRDPRPDAQYGEWVAAAPSLQAEEFLRVAKETLSNYGGRLRGLNPEHDISVLVFEGGGLPVRAVEDVPYIRRLYLQPHWTGRPSFVLQVSARAFMEEPEGGASGEERFGAIRVTRP